MVISHYFELIWYYRRFIVLFVGGTTLAAAGLSAFFLFTSPVYTATSSVTLLPTRAELSFTEDVVGGGSPEAALLKTQLEYLLSRPVAEIALKKISEQTSAAKSEESGWITQIRKAFSKSMREFRKLYNTINYGKFIPVDRHESALRTLMGSIRLDVVEGSLLLRITSTLRDPKAAAIVATELANAYDERMGEIMAASATSVGTYLAQQIADRETALQQVNAKEYQVRASIGVTNLDAERQALLEARETERSKLQDDAAELARLDALLTNMEANRAELQLQGIGAAVQEQIALGQPQRISIKAQMDSRRATLDRIEAKLAALSAKQEDLLALGEQKLQLRSEINSLRGQLVTIQLSKALAANQVRVVNPATVPIYPSFPKLIPNTVAGFAGAVVLALFCIVALDTVDGTVKTLQDLRRIVGERVLGRISPWGRIRKAMNGRDIGRSKWFKTFKSDVMSRLMTSHHLGTAPIVVTGFADSGRLCEAAIAVGLALAHDGRRVDLDLPGGDWVGTVVPVGFGKLLFSAPAETESKTADCELRVCRPIPESSEWREAARQGSILICVIQSGRISEGLLEKFLAEIGREETGETFFVLAGV